MKRLKFLRKFVFSAVALLALLAILVVGWVLWERNRNPLGVLPGISSEVRLVHWESTIDSVTARVLRHYVNVVLVSRDRSDTIRAAISFPPGYQSKKLPVVTVLGGQEVGRRNFELIPDPGENVLIIYEYPYSLSQWTDSYTPAAISRARSDIYSIPAQVLDLIFWAKKQEWADPLKMPLLGYSFGALFQPAVHHLAGVYGVPVQTGVIAYGGADLGLLVKENLKLQPEYLKPPVAWLVSTLLYHIDPKIHAPHMSGCFYLINGTKDHQIPNESWGLLHRLVPDPKKTDVLEEGHMSPGKPELTLKLVRMSRQWLEEQGMLNP